tara:strand:- start:102243 stop:103580 length:1338 start_codon:yes stop_codon:yes gene_type:complete
LIDKFLAKIRTSLNEYIVSKGIRTVFIAYSGGQDSTVLLHTLPKLDLGIEIKAIHINHLIQEESFTWERHCKKNCDNLGIDLIIKKASLDIKSPGGTEAQARVARYLSFSQIISKNQLLVTAHHADDQLETFLLRLLRGSGVKGLRGILAFNAFGNGYLARPFLNITKSEICIISQYLKLDWIEDISNKDISFDRNYLRHKILPQVYKRWPSAQIVTTRASEKMVEAESLLNTLAKIDSDRIINKNKIPIDFITGYDKSRSRNLLRSLISDLGLPVPSSSQLEALLDSLLILRNDAKTQVNWKGAEARIFKGNLYLFKPMESLSSFKNEECLSREKTWISPCGDLSLEVTLGSGLPDSWINEGLHVRFRKGGEKLIILNSTHHKTLKNLFHSKSIVPWMRDKIPLIYYKGQLVAVADLWLSDRINSEKKDDIFWKINWSNHPSIY